MDSARLKGNLDLLVLSVLADGPAHGYGIITMLRDRSDGAFDLAGGTVYPALHKLEKAGHIMSWWDENGPRRRRMYDLTSQGKRDLAAERKRWPGSARGVQSVVGVPS